MYILSQLPTSGALFPLLHRDSRTLVAGPISSHFLGTCTWGAWDTTSPHGEVDGPLPPLLSALTLAWVDDLGLPLNKKKRKK